MTVRIAALALILAVGVCFEARDAEAQAGKTVRIGVLRPAPDGPEFRQLFEPFHETLRENGFVEGRNLTIELRVRRATTPELLTLGHELVRLKVDAILAASGAGVRAAAQATRSIPIVAIDLESDPIASGFAASLARPGGNITGLFLDLPELSGKWIESLKAVVPNLVKVGVLADRAIGPSYRDELRAAGGMLGVQTLALDVSGPGELVEAFRSAVTERAGALLVLPSPVMNSARKQIAELAMKHRMPAIMPFAGFVDDGGLLAYGPDIAALWSQAGGITAKVLRGTRPREMPIERPTRFELTVNLSTARALGVTIPRTLLLRADRVIP